MKTAPTNKKVRELISMVKEGKLLPRAEFQRRLVWKREDKNLFLDSILRGYPFPEIYFADGDVDLDTGEGTQLLVDGLQRVSTIVQYFDDSPELSLTTVPAYRNLPEDSKKAFLQYDVAVRDLGSISREDIIEVFKRINATKYSLLDIEISNAVYSGALKRYSEELASSEFFDVHHVFNALDYKRMGDLRFALTIVVSMMQGYFNRDDAFEEYLARFNDDFPHEAELQQRLESTFSFIEECGFDRKSRIWKKADLLTTVCELDRALHREGKQLQPHIVLDQLNTFFSEMGVEGAELSQPQSIYYKATFAASNDRINRLRRGVIIEGVLDGKDDAEIMENLRSMLMLDKVGI